MSIGFMANIEIYVADDLKDRMSQVQTNWSEVCRRAIEAELSRVEAENNQPAVEPVSETEGWKQIPFDQRLLDRGL